MSTVEAVGERRKGLWQHPDFMKLWTAQTISQFGSGIGGTALELTAVLVLAATPAEMGLLGAVGSAPVLVIGLLAGVWVDRLRRRPILMAADIGRALLLLSIPLAFVFGVLHIVQLYVVAALVGVLTVFFDVADQSLLPTLVHRDQLVEANSKLGTSSSLAEIGGPALGGVLVQVLKAPFAIVIDAVSFLLSALALSLIRKAEPAPAPEAHASIRRDVQEGLRVVLGNPVLRALAGSSGMFTFFGNFIGTMYTLYAVRELGVPPALVGSLIGLGGIGALLGALIASRVTRRFGLGHTLIGTLGFAGLISLMIPLAGGPPLVAGTILGVNQLVSDVAIAVYLINDVSLRQAIIPERLLGRANASMHFLVGGAGPVGALVAGAVGEAFGPRLALVIGSFGIMAAVSWLVFSPVRRLQTTPEAPEAPGA